MRSGQVFSIWPAPLYDERQFSEASDRCAVAARREEKETLLIGDW